MKSTLPPFCFLAVVYFSGLSPRWLGRSSSSPVKALKPLFPASLSGDNLVSSFTENTGTIRKEAASVLTPTCPCLWGSGFWPSASRVGPPPPHPHRPAPPRTVPGLLALLESLLQALRPSSCTADVSSSLGHSHRLWNVSYFSHLNRVVLTPVPSAATAYVCPPFPEINVCILSHLHPSSSQVFPTPPNKQKLSRLQ